MADDTEQAKKLLLPFLQRANELQKHEPLVAYYCRLYALERGMNIPTKERTKETNAVLALLINQLEKDKNTLRLNSEDSFYIEGFALDMFATADKQDRSGRADMNTAKKFYAAGIFIEILRQFGELQLDIEEKQKYSVWKAADIHKAISEGRKPVPGPPRVEKVKSASIDGAFDPVVSPMKRAAKAEEQKPARDQAPNTRLAVPSGSRHEPENSSEVLQPGYEAHDSSMINHFALRQQPTDFASYSQHSPSSPSVSQSSNIPRLSGQQDRSNIMYNQYARASDATLSGHGTSCSEGGSFPLDGLGDARLKERSGAGRLKSAPATAKEQRYKPGPEKIVEAHKAARLSVSALAFNDVPTAISYLKQSLELLTDPSV